MESRAIHTSLQRKQDKTEKTDMSELGEVTGGEV